MSEVPLYKGSRGDLHDADVAIQQPLHHLRQTSQGSAGLPLPPGPPGSVSAYVDQKVW